MKFFVHDFVFEKVNIADETRGFLYHVSILCSLRKEFEEDEVERFSISVGNPWGVALYLKDLEESHLNHSTQAFVSDKFLISKASEEESIIDSIRRIINDISAKNENVLRIKMLKTFSWEYESYPEIVEKLYYM